jgi:glutathione-regulated potassium-efflux system ancillary protein KefG
VNRRLVAEAERVDGVTVRHLYEIYPDFLIDVREEQRLLETHDALVFQHPMYWYSAPSLVKEWMDLVLEHGWAYGKGGTALQGRIFAQAVTTGASKDAYCGEGKNRHSLREFLLPFEQSARLCGMNWMESFVVHGTADLKTADDIEPFARAYRNWLESLRDGNPNAGD